MLLRTLMEHIATARNNWETIKAEQGKDQEKTSFLKKSYLVMTHGTSQAAISEFETKLRRGEQFDFLASAPTNSIFIEKHQNLKKLQSEIEKLRQGTSDHKKALNLVSKLENELAAYDLSTLECAEDICIELRFSTLQMEIIQMIKSHPLIDTAKTIPSSSSIRVVIKSI